MLNKLSVVHEEGMNWKNELKNNKRSYNFFIITYGRCSFQYNDQLHTAEKGDFVLVPYIPDATVTNLSTSLHQKYKFHFQASEALYRRLPMLHSQSIVIASSGIFELSLEKLRPIWKEFSEQQQYSQLRMGSFLLDTLSLWQRELDRGELAPASLVHIERMKSYIQDHYRQKITKEHLGDVIRRSPNYAASLFKMGTGQTISQYVHAIRMKTAVYMLSESLLTITEIAEYLGYSDVSYFQRLFKRTYGTPPSLYIEERRSIK